MTNYIMVSNLNKGIAESIGRKRGKYGQLVKGWIHWSTKRSGINGTTDKYIRNMLNQILKEIHISQSKATSIINSVYRKDFDAYSITNKILNTSGIIDVLHKDLDIRKNSVDIYLNALSESGFNTNGMTVVQKAGLCIFLQYIMCGGRSELEGFGISSDLIENRRKKILNLQKEKLKARQKIPVIVAVDSENEKEEEITTQKEEDIPDSWEDL